MCSFACMVVWGLSQMCRAWWGNHVFTWTFETFIKRNISGSLISSVIGIYSACERSYLFLHYKYCDGLMCPLFPGRTNLLVDQSEIFEMRTAASCSLSFFQASQNERSGCGATHSRCRWMLMTRCCRCCCCWWRFVSDARVLVEVVAPPLNSSRPAVEQALNQTAHCEQVNWFALKLQSTCTSALTLIRSIYSVRTPEFRLDFEIQSSKCILKVGLKPCNMFTRNTVYLVAYRIQNRDTLHGPYSWCTLICV